MNFATHQLKGTAAACWENYLAARGESPVVNEESDEEESPEVVEQQDQATEENAKE